MRVKWPLTRWVMWPSPPLIAFSLLQHRLQHVNHVMGNANMYTPTYTHRLSDVLLTLCWPCTTPEHIALISGQLFGPASHPLHLHCHLFQQLCPSLLVSGTCLADGDVIGHEAAAPAMWSMFGVTRANIQSNTSCHWVAAVGDRGISIHRAQTSQPEVDLFQFSKPHTQREERPKKSENWETAKENVSSSFKILSSHLSKSLSINKS